MMHNIQPTGQRWLEEGSVFCEYLAPQQACWSVRPFIVLASNSSRSSGCLGLPGIVVSSTKTEVKFDSYPNLTITSPSSCWRPSVSMPVDYAPSDCAKDRTSDWILKLESGTQGVNYFMSFWAMRSIHKCTVLWTNTCHCIMVSSSIGGDRSIAA